MSPLDRSAKVRKGKGGGVLSFSGREQQKQWAVGHGGVQGGGPWEMWQAEVGGHCRDSL